MQQNILKAPEETRVDLTHLQVQEQVPLSSDGSAEFPRGGLHVRPAVPALSTAGGSRKPTPAGAEPPQGEICAETRLCVPVLHQPQLPGCSVPAQLRVQGGTGQDGAGHQLRHGREAFVTCWLSIIMF